MIAGALEIQMSANIARLTSDMAAARGVITSTMTSIEASVAGAKAMLEKFGVALSAGLFVAFIKGAVDALDHLNDLSKTTNIAVGDLAGLGLLAKQTGTDLDSLAKGINRMTVEIGKAPEKFAALGVTAKDGVGALKQVADIFNLLPDITQRNALAQAIFSKSWAELGPLLSEGGKAIGETIEKGKRLSGVTEEMTRAADAFNDKLAELSLAATGAKNNLVGNLLPSLQFLADNFTLVKGIVLTLVGVKLSTWAAESAASLYSTVTASMAAAAAANANRAATIEAAQADIVRIESTIAFIVADRAKVVQQMNAATATMAATAAVGAYSAALRLNAIAAADNSAALTELAALGRLQAASTAQLAAAQTALSTAQASAAASAGLASRALGLVGGPIGLITLALGLGATAWAVWGKSAEDAGDKAAKAVDRGLALAKRLQDAAKFGTGDIGTLNEAIAAAQARIAILNAQYAAAQLRVDQTPVELTPDTQALSDYAAGIRIAEAELVQLKDALKNAQVATKGLTDEQIAAAEKAAAFLQGLKGQQAFYERDITIRNLSLQSLKEGLANEQTVRDAFHAAGLISDEKYYNAQREMLRIQSQAEIATLTAILADELKLLSLADKDKPEQRTLAQGKVAKAELDIINAKAKAVAQLTVLDLNQLSAEKALTVEINKATLGMTEWIAMRVAANAAVLSSTIAQRSDIEQMRFENELIGKTVAEISALTAARRVDLDLRAAIAALPQDGDGNFLEGGAEAFDKLRAAAEAYKKTIAGLVADNSFRTYMKSLADGSANLWRKTGNDIKDSLTQAFGAAGTAAGGMFKAYADATAAQIELDKKRREDLAAAPARQAQIEVKFQNDTLQNTLTMYGDMAGAAASFFDKQSDAYKTLHGIEEVMYAWKFAMQLKEMIGNATVAASAVSSAATASAAVFAEGAAEAPLVVLNQGRGDPYTAWIRMAAMAAAVTALGFAVGGGFNSGSGSDQSAAAIQAQQGTGTVLGDSSAKSASLLDALKAIEAIDKIGLVYTHDMLDALRSIQNSMAGLASLIYRTTGLTTGGGFDITTGKIKNTAEPLLGLGVDIGGLVGKVDSLIVKLDPGGLLGALRGLWGSVSTSITDSGIMIAGSIRELLAGQGFNQYANVHTDSSSFFGLVHNTSDGTVTQGLDPQLVAQFKGIFGSIVDTVRSATQALGLYFPGMEDAIQNFVVDLGKVSLDGLKGQELQDALNGVFSKFADQLSLSVAGFGELQDLQKVGEGFFETLVRVASENEVANHTLNALGLSINTAGLHAIQARVALVELAGGVDTFTKNAQSYFENFFTAGEQRAQAGNDLNAEFARLGLAMPTTTAGFRALVGTLDLNTDAGRQTYTALMALNPAFASFVNSVVGLDGKLHSLDDVTQQHADLQDRLALAQGTLTQQEIDNRNLLNGAIDQTSLNLANAVISQEAYNAGVAAATERRGAEMALESQLAAAQGDAAKALAIQRSLDIEGMNAAAIASYDYQQSLKAQIAEQNKTNALADEGNKTSIDLLRAMGLEQQANNAERAQAIVGLTAAQVKLYDLNQTMKAQIALLGLQKEALKTETDLKKQLFDLSHTEAEILANNRTLKLAELAAQEQAAALVPGTLTAIQAQIDAQTDLNTAMQTSADLWDEFASSDMKLAKATQDVHDEFAKLGIAVPASKEAFANLVATIDPTTEAGKKFLEALKGIAPAFSTFIGQISTVAGVMLDFSTGYGLPVNPNAQNAANAAAKLESDRLALLASIYELTGEKAAAAAVLELQHAIALEALDPSLRGLQALLWALQAAAVAAAKAAEFAKTKGALSIQIARAQGNEELALELEHAQTIADINKQWGMGTDQANELIAMYQQLWAIQGDVVDSTADWIKSLQDWLRNLQLDSTLSPLTARQRFDTAHQQYVEDLLGAQNGDSAARSRITQDADAYLREAIAMFGRGTFQYEAIFRAINEQTQGLIDQGLGPSAPVTIGDLNTTAQGAAATAKQQMDALLAKIDTLNAKVEQQTQETRRGNESADLNHDAAQEAADERASAASQDLKRVAAVNNRAAFA